MEAEVEFFGNWVRVSIVFGGVKSHVGLEERIIGVTFRHIPVSVRS